MATSKNQNKRTIGKAQARQQFSPLVESLATSGGTVEITDYGKVAAVMLGYKDYISLLAKAGEPLKPKNQLRGSMVLVGDLEEATKEISKLMLESVAKTAAEL